MRSSLNVYNMGLVNNGSSMFEKYPKYISNTTLTCMFSSGVGRTGTLLDGGHK